MTSDNTQKQLQELSHSNYEIIEDQPDIRGWDVKNKEGYKLGEVNELIIDIAAKKVRYLILAIKDNHLGIKERSVLIPISLAVLHAQENEVILSNVTTAQLRALPDYNLNKLDSHLEHTIQNIFSPSETDVTTAISSNADFYSHERLEDNVEHDRTTTPISEMIRMRQEPSFLESEGSTNVNIDDDVDEMRDDTIEIDERDAIPVTNSPTLLSGNDIDEKDIADETTPPQNNPSNKPEERMNNEQRGTAPKS